MRLVWSGPAVAENGATASLVGFCPAGIDTVRPLQAELTLCQQCNAGWVFMVAAENGHQEEAEGVDPKVKRSPKLPSREEVEKHFAANHVPFRNWCSHCVMGKADNDPHRKVKSEETDSVPTVSMDYGYLTEVKPEEEDKEDQDGHMPTMFMVCGETGYLFANVFPAKGVNPPSVRKVVQNLEHLGHRKFNLKSDQENAILALKGAVKVACTTAECIIPEESPVGESQANGEIEGAIKLIKGQIRTMKLSLQTRYGIKLKPDHPVVPWMVNEAAKSINRYHVGLDGKTRRERLKGKKFHRETAEFAECIYYLVLKTKGKY